MRRKAGTIYNTSKLLIPAGIAAAMLLLLRKPGQTAMAGPVHYAASGTAIAAPDLWVSTQDGKMTAVARQQGKVVFLNFWATSCVPCKAEMATIDELRKHYSNDTNVLIIPVDLDNKLSESAGFMTAHNLGLTVYRALGTVPDALFNGVLPTTVVIDNHGKIALYHEGEGDYSTAEFRRYIDSLCRE